MSQIKTIALVFISIIFINCESDNDKFPINKRYWDTQDYEKVTRTLRFGTKSDEKLPTFDDPETRLIVEKYTDSQNYSIVLNDKELGIKHKNRVGEEFFLRWQDMTYVYTARDRKDNFIYEKEMLAVHQFGLGLQLKYFKLGNDEIINNSDSPNDAKHTINSNINSLISNYKSYLDYINDEQSFSEAGIKIFSNGIVKYYTMLIKQYPKGNYNSTKSKMETLKKKAKSEVIKNSLDKIIKLIDEKQVKVE